MAYSRQIYVSDGATVNYPITFAEGYLSKTEVVVYLKERNADGSKQYINFTWVNDNMIALEAAPANGTKFIVERDVSAAAVKAKFVTGYIPSSDLNTEYKHLLYLIQAILDGRIEEPLVSDLDMGGNRLVNLGLPVDDNDAARWGDIKQVIPNANAAAESAGLAANSATAASASEANAKVWADGTDSEVQALGGVHSSKGWSEAAQAVVDSKQDIANLSQTIDDSTTKYPSNAAVKAAIDAKVSLPAQSGNSGKFLTTDGTITSWGEVDVSGAINTHNTDLNAHSNKFKVVSALPASPETGTFYFIPEV